MNAKDSDEGSGTDCENERVAILQITNINLEGNEVNVNKFDEGSGTDCEDERDATLRPANKDLEGSEVNGNKSNQSSGTYYEDEQDVDYRIYTGFIMKHLAESLSLPGQPSVSLICKGGFNYTFSVVYPQRIPVQNNGRCSSASPSAIQYLPPKFLLRFPIHEMDSAVGRGAWSDLSEAVPSSDLRDIAAKNIYAGLESSGLRGPKIFAYDCECLLPWTALEYIEGKDLHDELPSLTKEDYSGILEFWPTDARACQSISFDRPGRIIAHPELAIRDWPLFWEREPLNLIQVKLTLDDVTKTSSNLDFHSLIKAKLKKRKERVARQGWEFMKGQLDVLDQVTTAIGQARLGSKFRLHDPDFEPRNIMIERLDNGEIKIRRIDFDQLVVIPSPCCIRSAWPTLKRCHTFPSTWSENDLIEVEQDALNSVLQHHRGLDQKEIEFNDFLFIYLRVIESDFSDENTFKRMNCLKEQWPTYTEEFFQSGSALYKSYCEDLSIDGISDSHAPQEPHPATNDNDGSLSGSTTGSIFLNNYNWS